MLSVGAPAGLPFMGAGGAGEVVDRTFLRREGEDVPAAGREHTAAVGREAEVAEPAHAAAVFAAAPDVVGFEGDLHLLRLAAATYVVPIDPSAVLEDYPVGGAGGELAVVFAEVGDLLGAAADGVVGEEVHGPVPVGEVEYLVAHPHGEDVLCVVVGDLRELGGADGVDPDVVGLASAVVFPGAELAEHPVHRELLSVGREGAEAALARGDDLGHSAVLRVNEAEVGPESAETVLLAAVDYLASVGSPAHHDVVGPHALSDLVAVHAGRPGEPFRLSALYGHGVDFGVAVVLAGEGYGAAVGGYPRETFVSRMGGQAHGGASVDVHAVEVSGVAEHDLVASDCGETQQPGLFGGSLEQRRSSKGQCKQNGFLHGIRCLFVCRLPGSLLDDF